MIDTKTLRLDVDDGGNMLLMSPEGDDSDRAACIDLLTLVDPGRSNLLVVTYRDTPDEWYRRWTKNIGEQPQEIGMVSVGEATRSTAAGMPVARGNGLPSDSPVVSVPATDLTELGIAVNRYIAEWGDNRYRTVLCFDSLSAMLQWTDLETAFRFLHVLTSRLDSVDAIAHFHCDPTVHDETVLRTLSQLFDQIIDEVPSHHHPLDNPQELEQSTMVEALSSTRRRIVLRELVNRPGYVSIRELAQAVVEAETNVEDSTEASATDRQRAMTQLHHTDLPKLEESGILTYDIEENVVSLDIEAKTANEILETFGQQ